MELRKESIDIGITCVDAPAMLAFYRDVLGLVHQGDNRVPGGGSMHRLLTGTGAGAAMLKLVALEPAPTSANPPGGLRGGTGLRYFTFMVDDLDAALAPCEQAGRPVVQRSQIGQARLAIVEDPDGNWVELVQVG